MERIFCWVGKTVSRPRNEPYGLCWIIMKGTIFDIHSIPLDTIPTGVYNVVLSLSIPTKSKKDSVLATSHNNIYLINRSILLGDRRYYTEDEQFELSEFATYSSERAELFYEQCKVIATFDEIAVWDILTDLKAKQRFLYKFWLVRNPDPDNPYNIKLAEFRFRLKHVNTYYSFGGSLENGWKSDRGKIYLTFGEPSDKEDNWGNAIDKPYQIWIYHTVEGGSQFVFVDISRMDNHRLVHSTHPEYITNYNWQIIVNPNSSIDR